MPFSCARLHDFGRAVLDVGALGSANDGQTGAEAGLARLPVVGESRIGPRSKAVYQQPEGGRRLVHFQKAILHEDLLPRQPDAIAGDHDHAVLALGAGILQACLNQASAVALTLPLPTTHRQWTTR